MDFRTELTLKTSPWKIDLNDSVLTLGSCFSQSIGQKFLQNKFKTQVNPFGTTYHPVAIHRILNYVVFHENPTEHLFQEKEGTFYHYDFHSQNAAPTQAGLQRQLNESIGMLHYFLKNCKVLMITYGTAWIYERTDTGEPVANCHKMPEAQFSKRLVTIEEISKSFLQTYQLLKTLQPALRVILTVSPVRHVKDTLSLNMLSKSMLRVACHEISQACEDVDYFPAFEIMMDDLRDYRFYKDDLIHPTVAAERYIWEKFRSAYFGPSTLTFLKQWEDIQHLLAHRPFQPESKAHQDFLCETLDRLEELKSIVNVDDEITIVRNQIQS